MNYSKIAIRVLFASLIIAALAGAATLIAPSSNYIIGRLIGTAIATAITSGLLLIAIRALEQTSTKAVGSALWILVCAIYMLTISAIWIDAINTPASNRLTERLAISAFLLSGCGVPILISTSLFTYKRLQLAGKVTFLIWLLLTTGWLIKLWFFKLFINDTYEYILSPLAIFSPIIALVLINKNAYIRAIGLLIACLGMISLQVSLIYTDGDVQHVKGLFIAALTLGGVAASLGLINLLLIRSNVYSIVWAERITFLVTTSAITFACIAIWFELNRQTQVPESIVRFTSGTSILASTSIIAVLISQYIKSATYNRDKTTKLKATCPRCSEPLQIPQGRSSCSICGLRIKLNIESSACRKCNYNLRGVPNTENCPECGEPISIKAP